MKQVQTWRRKVIAVEKRVAIGLWHFAQGSTYFATGDKFAVSTSAAHGIVFESIDAVISVFQYKVVFPEGDALHQAMKGFESLRQIPNCCGAINSLNILLTSPAIEFVREYVDRSGKMSAILPAVTDSQGLSGVTVVMVDTGD